MPSVADNTPIVIGVGQASERLDSPNYQQLAPVDLAARAAAAACDDALSLAALGPRIDAIFAVRTVADSVPAMMRPHMAPFGSPSNSPASVARRLGANPALLVHSPACGDEPQKLLNEACERLHRGDFKLALLCGGEAISTQRAAKGAGQTLDWSEQLDMPLEDRSEMMVLRSKQMTEHGMKAPTAVYPLLENARRKRLGLSREAYAKEMGRLLAPFSEVAANNPHASSQKIWTAQAIASTGAENRLIADPHPISVVARDQVNQGAAVLLTTVGTARELGIAEEKWVYLHGYSAVNERPVLERQDLGASAAMALAYQKALEEAGTSIDQIRFLDIYSCFPIAVFSALDAIGLDAQDPRGLTLTGGLPFFGGPGNNYSMHGIAEVVQRLRQAPGTLGLIGANGGFLSTHAVGIYSTSPREWKNCDSTAIQYQIDQLPAPAFKRDPDGWATVESYTVLHGKQGPSEVIIVGRLELSGERFIAHNIDGDEEGMQAFADRDGLLHRVCIRGLYQGRNLFAMSQQTLDRLCPKAPRHLLAQYEHVQVERRGHVLEVIINRPQANNALTPEANDELEQVFDTFDADASLWVAILTGAGTRAFCTGNDLKVSASGRRMWMPRTGFGGLTARRTRVKPVIAAVNGFAMGGGFEIALASDLIVADDKAQFALSEVRVGLAAGAGGMQRLTRQIPYKQAVEMILTGRRCGAAEGKELGFVNQVVPEGTALEAARKLADELLESSPTSIRVSMELLSQSEQFASTLDSVNVAYPGIDKLLSSDDFMEGLTAFGQKRKPQWKNR